jgi:hypothetical protein
MLGIFLLRERRLRTLVWQTNLAKEANLSRNPEKEGPYSTRLLRQYLLVFCSLKKYIHSYYFWDGRHLKAR